MKLSTKAILAFRSLGRDIDEQWVDWAVSMMLQNYDTPHLNILAGISPPFYQTELMFIVDKALKELGLDWSDKGKVVKEYIVELLEKLLSGELSKKFALGEIKDIYVEEDYKDDLHDFYLLYYALDDLETSEVQWYWNGADRKNIDKIITTVSISWIQKYSG
ncbi:MAG: hypothetical protein Q8933_18240 [Bacteroidota bacterium]|nr:hypothetical protein [Bacteroidota bacterium]MDP4197138.1 hypothetical protein [Bacteroidota bacterium]